MGRGYSSNHPRFSHRQDERYDAKEAYNKDLTASARLHYLENDRHDHDSPAHGHCTPMHKHTRAHRLRERAIKISERSGAERGDEYDYENPKVMDLLKKANELDERSNKKIMPKVVTQALVPNNDERSGEIRNEMIDEMIDDRPDALMDEFDKAMQMRKSGSPMNACAKSEGGSGCIKQMGGAWRVISNKTDKPWPAKYASKSKAEAALRGYHAG